MPRLISENEAFRLFYFSAQIKPHSSFPFISYIPKKKPPSSPPAHFPKAGMSCHSLITVPHRTSTYNWPLLEYHALRFLPLEFRAKLWLKSHPTWLLMAAVDPLRISHVGSSCVGSIARNGPAVHVLSRLLYLGGQFLLSDKVRVSTDGSGNWDSP